MWSRLLCICTVPALSLGCASESGGAVRATDENGGGAGSQGNSPASGNAPSGNSPSLGGCTVFPASNAWNADISSAPLHPNSAAFIASIGPSKHVHPDFGTEWDDAPIGIPFAAVGADQPWVPVEFTYVDESDPGPYPIPRDAPIEGGPDAEGDRHVLVVDTTSCMLYELFNARPESGGARWSADSGAVFDLRSNELRPARWTSADAAGLPILPGLVRYDEVVERGEIPHALRFTVSRSQRAYVSPATHAAASSTDAALPPMGLRLRMKQSYDCSSFSAEARVVCTALKTYGMLVADNGSDWYLSGAHDMRWNDDHLGDLKRIPGEAFEVVDSGPIVPY